MEPAAVRGGQVSAHGYHHRRLLVAAWRATAPADQRHRRRGKSRWHLTFSKRCGRFMGNLAVGFGSRQYFRLLITGRWQRPAGTTQPAASRRKHFTSAIFTIHAVTSVGRLQGIWLDPADESVYKPRKRGTAWFGCRRRWTLGHAGGQVSPTPGRAPAQARSS